MAGKRQHDIPCFLLNGFASRTQGKNHFVWCFRKEKPPFEPNTLNVGLKKFFYGESGPETLDDLITKKEGTYAECVNRVREERTLTPYDEETFVEFVYSLTLRSRHLRGTIQNGLNSMFGELASVFTDADRMPDFMLEQMRKDTPMWREGFESYIRKTYGVLNRSEKRRRVKQEKKSFERWFKHGMEDHARKEAKKNKRKFEQWDKNAEDMLKTSHNDALKRVLFQSTDEPSPGSLRFRQLNWHVKTFENGALILGDIVVLQFDRQSQEMSSVFGKKKGDIILMPLSHNLLVVGASERMVEIPTAHEINRNTAQLSLDFFISSRNSKQEAEYQSLLGIQPVKFKKILD